MSAAACALVRFLTHAALFISASQPGQVSVSLNLQRLVKGCSIAWLSVAKTIMVLASFNIFSQWGSADAEMKVSSVVNPELTYILLLKPGVGRDTALYAFAHCQELFVSNFYRSGPFSIIFFPKHYEFFFVVVVYLFVFVRCS